MRNAASSTLAMAAAALATLAVSPHAETPVSPLTVTVYSDYV